MKLEFPNPACQADKRSIAGNNKLFQLKSCGEILG